MMGVDETRGPLSPIIAPVGSTGKSDPMLMIAVMVILVVFIFVIFAIFALKRDRHNGEGLTEIAAASMLTKQGNHGYGDQGYGGYGHAGLFAHDNSRDNLREFGEIKKEIAVEARHTDEKLAEYAYKGLENQKNAELNAYKLAVEEAEKTRAEMRQIEAQRRSDELARERESNIVHRIVASLKHQHQPAYARAYVADDMGLGLGAMAG